MKITLKLIVIGYNENSSILLGGKKCLRKQK